MSKFPNYNPYGRNYCNFFVPLERRFETCATLLHCSSIILFPCLYFYLWTKESLWPFLILYTFYSYFVDNSQTTGECIYRSSEWLRTRYIFKGFINYFPIYTHRSVVLPPTLTKEKRKTLSYHKWTFFLPLVIKNILENFKIIRKQERIIEFEKKIGPKYLFACHPHGVISFGITGSLCWGGTDKIWNTKVDECKNSVENKYILNKKQINVESGSHLLKTSRSFTSLFPGISMHLLTIPTQFLLPFYRDYIMGLGVGLVTKLGIKSIFKKNHSVAIVIGGAHESLLAKPGSNKIVLNRRKGFIKISLEACNKSYEECRLNAKEIQENVSSGKWDSSMSDIAIVPVYVYGENNIYNVYNTIEENAIENENKENDMNSTILKTFLNIQLFLKKYTGFTLPLTNSRSIFNYDFGLLPYKRRIDVLIGKPIYIYRRFGNSVNDKVTEEEINYYHNLYKNELYKLWEKNKAFSTEWDEDLQIVE